MKNLIIVILVFLTNGVFSQNLFPATGFTGIGTTTPAYDLDVNSTGSPTLRVGSPTGTSSPNFILKSGPDFWKFNKTAPGTGFPVSDMNLTYNNGLYGGDHQVMGFVNWQSSFSITVNSTTRNIFNTAALGVNGLIGGTAMVLSTNITNPGVPTGSGWLLGVDGGICGKKLLISPSGNNTTLLGATALVAVDGKIAAREVIVSTITPFPDYVFKTGYKLRSLSEIEKYIKENDHLPEMPSAEEVTKNGLELANTTTLLVQKVEEMTLHLIEMSKRIEALETENAKLRRGHK